jgi:putative transposase
MPFFNPEIHHRKSTRLTGYDYSTPGNYFITICLDNVRCMLAGWNKGRLNNTPVGDVAAKYWMEIPIHYPNMAIDAFVIMPDHLHGILRICESTVVQSVAGRGVLLNAPTPTPLHAPTPNAQTQVTPKNSNDPKLSANIGNNQSPQSSYFSEISPMGGTLSVIIRNYKSVVRHWCNKNGFPQFRWQRGFYDRIIREESELARIRWYIRNNPKALQDQFPGLR